MPETIWRPPLLLYRVHLELHGTAWFDTGPHGRFNPPPPPPGTAPSFGTCYLATHPRGAFLETLGRFNPLPRTEVDRRVLAAVLLPSDVRLADLTHPWVGPRFGLTAAAQMGAHEPDGPLRRWADRLQQAGFGGVFYGTSGDAQLLQRSVALFGKPGEQETAFAAVTEPVPESLLEKMALHYGYRVLPPVL